MSFGNHLQALNQITFRHENVLQPKRSQGWDFRVNQDGAPSQLAQDGDHSRVFSKSSYLQRKTLYGSFYLVIYFNKVRRFFALPVALNPKRPTISNSRNCHGQHLPRKKSCPKPLFELKKKEREREDTFSFL